MFVFSDYFFRGKEREGYRNGWEQIEDILHFADMLLEHFLDVKTLASEGLVFSRGLKMTEAETESYFFLPPKRRHSLGYDEGFAEEAKKAHAYLRERAAHTDEGVCLPFSLVCRRFALDDYEKLALALALAVETDLKYARIFGYIASEPGLAFATTGVAEALYASVRPGGAGMLGELSVMVRRPAALLYNRELFGDGARPLLQRPLVLHPAVRQWLLSGEGAPPAQGDFVCRTQGLPVFYDRELRELEACAGAGVRFCYLESVDERDAVHVMDALSRETGRSLVLFDAEELLLDPAYREERALILRLQPFLIQTRLLDEGEGVFVLCRLAKCPLDLGEKSRMQWEKQLSLLLGALDDYLGDGLIGLCGEAAVPVSLLSLPRLFVLHLSLPGAALRYGMWQACLKRQGLPLAEDISVKDLADCYALSMGRIWDVTLQAQALWQAGGEAPGTSEEDRPALSRQQLLSVLFRINTANFSNLATRIDAAYRWDDIAMEEGQKQRLLAACDRFRLKSRMEEAFGFGRKNAYGNGVSVLLYGPPGTGKTMAAQVVANELGLLLYRVDVSQIFSKYIGETQKNLAQIFEEAQKTNVILFFDEADALFAKRTEVKDSHDRHANAETAFLLQKIEEYSGMTILATNLFHQFDAAFVRRITYVVHMDSPNEETRLMLWQHTLPEDMPVGKDVDFTFLAKQFELSGSNIKSVLFAAAYLAGARAGDVLWEAEGRPVIAMADIVLALRFELEKMGRIIDAGEFGSYGMYLQLP